MQLPVLCELIELTNNGRIDKGIELKLTIIKLIRQIIVVAPDALHSTRLVTQESVNTNWI